MKLKNLREEEQEYTSNIEEITKFLKDVKYKKSFKMNTDGSINLNAIGVLELTSILKKYPKISKAKKLEIAWYGAQQNGFLDIMPRTAEELVLRYFKPSNKTLTLGSYDSLKLDNCIIKTVEVESCYAFEITENSINHDFKKLIVHDKSINDLKLNNMILTKNEKIYDDHVMSIRLMSITIDTFENIFSSCDYLNIVGFTDITSWKGIGDLDIRKEISLPYYAPNINNIIHIMLSTVEKIWITLHSGSFRSHEEIDLHVGLKSLERYFDNIKRKDFIMDVAVELIDAGFEEAAEL